MPMFQGRPVRPASDIVAGAIELINTTGWTQGTLGNRHVGYCTIGAVFASAREEVGILPYPQHREDPRIQLIIRTVQDITGAARIGTWNDAPSRTKDEVLAVLQAAQENLKGHGK